MKTLARVLLVLPLVAAGLALARTWAVDRGNSAELRGRETTAEKSDRKKAHDEQEDPSESRGSGRFEGRNDEGKEDHVNEDADNDEDSAEKIPPDGTYHFAYEWKWNGDRDIGCDIPMSDIVRSEEELKAVEKAKDPFAFLGINWKKYNDDERNVLFWQNLYRYLYRKNSVRITNLTGKFRELREKEKLSDRKLFEAVLSFVQSLEYKRPGGQLDVLTQPEALYRKFGDCDTKSLLLITLLNGLGYDTVIYYSGFYSHAMAGVYMNGTGEYKKLDGKRYYFVETTYPGWKPGTLPKDFSNPRYWDVCRIR